MASADEAPLGVCAVLGGAGFLGAALVQRLASVPGVTSIIALDVAAPPAAVKALAECFVLDIADADAVQRCFRELRPETVFHTAAVIDIRAWPTSRCWEVNVAGTGNVLAACRAAGCYRLVYTSTLDCCATANGMLHVAEDALYATPDFFSPADGYKVCKAQGELLVLSAASAAEGASGGALQTTALRLAHLFGPGDDLLPMLAGKRFALGHPSVPMSMVYVCNAAAAHERAARRLAHGGASASAVCGKPFFVADFDCNFFVLYRALTCGLPLERAASGVLWLPRWFILTIATVLDVFGWVMVRLTGWRLVREPKKCICVGAVRDATQPLCVRSDAAREAFGYEPVVAAADAIAATAAWWRQAKSGR